MHGTNIKKKDRDYLPQSCRIADWGKLAPTTQ